MSSYHDQFVNFHEIPPKLITAADKCTFEAIGKGDMYVSLPNGKTCTHILLKDVLYALKMGLMLVSISKLDAAGYSALFCDSHCKIFDAKKKVLGVIPVNKGLYAVNAPWKLFAGTASAEQPLTMEEVHAWLGHIAPESIQQILKAGTITGIKLDPAHSTMGSCESCEYAKATQKPIGKVKDPPRHAKLGEEVHTDLWGPSPVKMNA
ncbi:hypothetical protein ID866_13378 [Astraeus odoratus]|nr:hypothetical protein ID866_13378 [Astraeus odoratus]